MVEREGDRKRPSLRDVHGDFGLGLGLWTGSILIRNWKDGLREGGERGKVEEGE